MSFFRTFIKPVQAGIEKVPGFHQFPGRVGIKYRFDAETALSGGPLPILGRGGNDLSCVLTNSDGEGKKLWTDPVGLVHERGIQLHGVHGKDQTMDLASENVRIKRHENITQG